jgi:hypothetical protein
MKPPSMAPRTLRVQDVLLKFTQIYESLAGWFVGRLALLRTKYLILRY